ncbi:MAG: GIY-YIG nuclease family protein [Cellulosilyticaceae bacterium]
MTVEALRQQAKALPLLPGVYLMKDALGNTIYVGKSKALKNRVSSYFAKSQNNKPTKVKRLIKHIDHFEVIETDTELDALLLECRLIKQFKPIYNTLLKQDKKYRYIWIDPNSPLPRMEVAYERGEEGAYFGPFDIPYLLSTGAAAINGYYGLASCKEPMAKEGCLTYRLGQCLGPCDQVVLTPEYKNKIKQAIVFLEGQDSQIIDYYQTQMYEASATLDFEKATKYRDYLNVLKRLGVRKEAIAFSLANEEHFMVAPVPKGGIKLYRLRGTRITGTLLMESEDEIETAKKVLRSQGAEEEEKGGRVALDKGEIDEAQIIYWHMSNYKI